jgi:hypothetical protein
MTNFSDKRIWSHPYWEVIHFTALGYPIYPRKIDKNNYKSFYLSIKDIIPCEECGIHLEKNLKNLPLIDDYLNNRDKLFEWTVLLHNQVNKMLGKKEWTLKEAKRHYLHPFYRWKKISLYDFFGNPYIIIILFLVISVIIYLRKKKYF